MPSDENIYDILKFRFDPIEFAKVGEKIIFTETRVHIEKSKKILQEIIDNSDKFDDKPPKNYIEETYNEFIQTSIYGEKTLINTFNSSKKVKRLVWALSYSENNKPRIIDTNYFITALNLLSQYWRNNMFISLIEVLFQNWDKKNDYKVKKTRELLSQKLLDYKGKRSSILNWLKNMDLLLRENSPMFLVYKLFNEKLSIKDSLNIMSLPEYMRYYPYFSDVVEQYTTLVLKNNQLSLYLLEIVDFLKYHESKDASKKCLSKMILNVNQVTDDLKEDIKASAFKLIGDPSNDSYWMPWKGASYKDIEELKEAQNLLNQWINEKFITLFFEEWARDNDRKIFWRKYLKDISRFKIYGSETLEYRLKRDERIAPYLSTRFGILKGGSNSTALVMVIKDYLLVEFSENGNAFYAYKTSNEYCPNISLRTLRVHELKNTRSNNGRFIHSGGWQYNISSWITEKIGVRR